MTNTQTVCFDIDGTLYDYYGRPREDIIKELKRHIRDGNKVYVWSGGGVDYAKRVVERLGLEVEVIAKGKIKPDIAYDDMEVTLGIINIKV